MAKQPLGGQGTWPAPEKSKQMQGALLGAPMPLLGSGFIESVSEESDDACDEIDDEDNAGQAPGNNGDNDKDQKANGKQRGNVAAPRGAGWSGPVSDEPYRTGLSTALAVDLQFIGDEFLPFRPAPPIRKGADMYEDLLSATIGRDEAEAFVILPSCDSTLIAHGR